MIQTRKIIVAIPSTLTSVEKNRLLRAYVIGQLARFFGMYRVTHVFVYYDKDPYFDSHALGKYIVKTLRYAVTPPWLKKHAFPIEDTDRYWGVIPPLQIRAHQEEMDQGWGVVLKNSTLLWRGKRKRININELKKMGYGERLPQLVAVKHGEIIRPYDLERESYIGFWARYFNKPLPDVIRFVRKTFNAYIVGTDREGEYISDARERLTNAKENVMIVFGGHHRGITEMEGFNKKDYDVIVSLFQKQETKTVRTEEAVPLVLEAFHRIGMFSI